MLRPLALTGEANVLPDYYALRKEIQHRQMALLRDYRDKHLGPLAAMKVVTLHEGRRHETRHLEGDIERGEVIRMASELRLTTDEILDMTMEESLVKLEGIGKSMAAKITEETFRRVSEAVERVGNMTDAKGRQLTASLILDTFAKVQIDFAQDGSPIWPSLHIPPKLAAAAEKALLELDNDPELKVRLGQLVETKREEWRVREANRALVG